MARPLKIGLDYFPLDVRFDDEIELLEAEEGLTGFAILIKLWQKIYSNGYYIEWNDDSILLFCKNINSEKTKVISVVNTCLRRNLFNKKLFDKYKILTSCGIQKRFITASSQSKRKTISIIQEYMLINSEFTELITELTSLNQKESTQKKVKESKEEESKEKTPFEKTFDDFLLMRKNIKKIPTERAVQLIKDKLIKLSNGNDNIAIDILNQSILNNWQDVFPLKTNHTQSATVTQINRTRAL
jgi:hypothetical protein